MRSGDGDGGQFWTGAGSHKKNYGKGTNNNDEEPDLATDLLQGLNLRMDDNHKMFELINISVKDIKKLVDADSERPKRTTQGHAPS